MIWGYARLAHTQGGEVFNFAENVSHRRHRLNRFTHIIYDMGVCASRAYSRRRSFQLHRKCLPTDDTGQTDLHTLFGGMRVSRILKEAKFSTSPKMFAHRRHRSNRFTNSYIHFIRYICVICALYIFTQITQIY